MPITGKVIMSLYLPTNYTGRKPGLLPLRDTIAGSDTVLPDLKGKGYVTPKLHT
jgi:hypothetical protein